MPHVASDTRTQAIAHARQNAPRQAQANERTQGPSFESMLDDNAAEAAARAEPRGKSRADATDHVPAKSRAADRRMAKSETERTDKSDGADAEKPAANAAPEKAAAMGTAATDSAGADTGSDQLNLAAELERPVANDAAPVTSDGAAAPDTVGTQSAATPAAMIVVARTQVVTADDAGVPQSAQDEAPAQDAGADGDKSGGDPAIAPPAPAGAASSGPAQQTAVPAASIVPAADKLPAAAATAEAAKPAHIGQAATAVPVKPTVLPESKAPARSDAKPAADTGPALVPADETAAPPAKMDAPTPEMAEAGRKADAQARGEAPARAPHAPVKTDMPAAPPVTTDAASSARPDAAQAMNAAPAAQPAHNATQTASLTPVLHNAAPAPQAAAVPIAGVAVEIAGRALAGKNHFEIRLDPPELGRIEVRLDVDRDGHITSHVIADRRDTLDLLQRDSAALQRALQDAGLKTADNALQFSLRDQPGGAQPERGEGNAVRLVAEDDTLPAIDALQAAQSRLAARRGGIDIRI